MFLRRRVSGVLHLLYRYRYVGAALTTYLLFRSATRWWPDTIGLAWTFGVALAVLSVLAFLSVPTPPTGRLAERRQIEAALTLMLLVAAVGLRVESPLLNFAAFPLFLGLVYFGYRPTQLAFLFLVEGAMRLIDAGSVGAFVGHHGSTLTLLAVWTGLSTLFRSQERRKRKEVFSRLHMYEREATTLASGSKEVEEVLRMEERTKTHLAAMIREREKSFRNLLDILFKTFEPHTCALYLYDPADEVFLLKDFLTDSDRFAERRVQELDGIFRAIHRETGPVRLVSAAGDLRGLTYYEGSAPVRSVIAMPIRSGDQLKGVIVLDRVEPEPFGEEESETIEQIAGQLARAIDNTEALHAYFHLKEELAAFYEASSALNRSLRVEDIVRVLLNSTKQIVHYDWGLVILHDAVTGKNTIAAEEGGNGEGWVDRSFANASERGLVSWVIENRAPLDYGHFRTRENKTLLFHKNLKVPNIYGSIVILPLHLKGESIGALLFAAQRGNFFSRNVRKMLEVVSVLAATSLKNARMVTELEKLATTDGLTGLANHRTFQETLATELERSGRHPSPTSLLLVDIDYFKRCNDEYGHPVGDFVLREIAGVLARTVRKVDTVARYGGEEFGIILVNATASGALQMAQRINQEVARSRFEYQGLTLRVTVSIGVSTYPDDSVTREELIECSDRALYESKRTGRNRVTVYTSSLGRISPERREERLIRAAEDDIRRLIDHEGLPV